MAHRTKVTRQIFYLFTLYLPVLLQVGLLSTLLIKPAYALGARPPLRPYYIRVAVAEDKASFLLTIRSAYQIRALNTGELLLEGKSFWKKNVFPLPAGIKIGEDYLKLYGVKVQPQKDSAIYINNRRFRGNINIIRTKEKRLLVVNNLDIEDYLYGVLPREVPYYWPGEVLKAQAIAARSFALYQSRLNPNADYELTSTVYSQVYGGRTSERYRANRAIRQTQGKVLVYKGELFPAYYHANSGGYTEDAKEIFGIDIPPLKGAVSPYDRKARHFLWKQEIPLSDIEAKLSQQGYELGKISSIVPEARNESNRITSLRISGNKGAISLAGYKFRLYLGPNLIRSANFTVKVTPARTAIFSGFGWGHGVGLSQWGAYFMAKQGYRAEEILKFYYPGAEIVQIGDVLEGSQ